MVYMLLLAVLLSLFSTASSSVAYSEIAIFLLVFTSAAITVVKIFFTPGTFPKPVLFLFFYFVIACSSILWAVQNGVEVTWWFRRFVPVFIITVSVIICYYDSSLQDNRNIWKIVQLLVAFLLFIMALNVFHVFINGAGLQQLSLQQMRSFGSGFASAFIVALIFPFIIAVNSSRFIGKQWFLYISFFIASISLILSYTRTYWVATAVAVFAVVGLMWKLRLITRTRILLLAVIFGSIVLIVLVIKPQIITYAFVRIQNLINFAGDESFQDRMMELKGIWSSALEQPMQILIGHGLGATFSFYSVNPFAWGSIGLIENDYSHNYFGYLFFSVGIMGVTAFVLFMASVLRFMARHVGNTKYEFKDRVLMVSIICTVINLFITLLFAPPLADYKWNLIYGILIGCGFRLCMNEKRRLDMQKG